MLTVDMPPADITTIKLRNVSYFSFQCFTLERENPYHRELAELWSDFVIRLVASKPGSEQKNAIWPQAFQLHVLNLMAVTEDRGN